MWFQQSMEYLPGFFILQCDYFSLLPGLPSNVNMLCGILLIYWCGARKLPINLKGGPECLEIDIFDILEYSVGSEIGHVILLQAKAYYVHGLPNNLHINSPQVIYTS